MYKTSEKFNNDIKSYNRVLDGKVIINDTTYTKSNIKSINIDQSLFSGNTFTIGETFANKVEIQLYDVANSFSDNQIVKPYFCLKVNEAFEEIPMGVFYINSIEQSGKNLKIIAYDKMYSLENEFISELTYPTTITNVMNEIKSKHNITYSGTLDNITVYDNLKGYSIKQIIGFVASIQGENARFNRLGILEFITPTDSNFNIDKSQYFNLTKGNSYKISGLTCKFGSIGNSRGDNTHNILTFSNPWIRNEHMDLIFNRVKVIEYYTCKFKYTGNFALDVGEYIDVVDLQGNIIKALICNQSFKFTGGITSELESIGQGQQESEIQQNRLQNKKSFTELDIKLGQINAKVEEIEKLNNIEGVIERIESAEQKVTPSAIISTVINSVEYKNDLEEKTDITQFTELKQEFDSFELKASDNGGSNFIIEGNKEYYFDLRADNSLQKKPLEVDSKFIKSIKGQKITLSFDAMGWQNNLQDNIFTGLELEVTYTDSAKSWHNVTVENASYIKHRLSGGEYQRYVSHSTIENKNISEIYLSYYIRGFNGEIKVKNACITLGHTTGAYIQHETSLIEGITRIDLNGVTVEHSETNTKTNLNSESLSILDKYSNKELAYFGRGNKAYIDTLETNRVISDSVIPLVMDKGNINIYVQVGGSGNGSGTDSNNRASSINNALEQLAIRWGLKANQFSKGINLKGTNIVVNCSGTTSYSENVLICNIRGGSIQLNFGSNTQITGTITFTFCDYAHVIGNRSGADTNDGARFYRTGSGDAISFIGCKTSTCIKARFYNTTKTGNAINCYWGGTLYVNSLDIYGFDVGIFMGDGGRIHSCNTSGHNMNYGFKADAGSIINAVFRIPNVNNSYNNGSIFLPDSNNFGTTKQNSYQVAPPTPTYTSQTNEFSGHGYKSVRPSYSSENIFYQSHYNSQYGAWCGYVYFSSVKEWLSNASGQATAKIYLQRRNTSHGYPTGARPNLVGYGYLVGDSTGTNGLSQGQGDWFTIPATIINEFQNGTRDYLSFTDSSAYHYIYFENNAKLKVIANKPN